MAFRQPCPREDCVGDSCPSRDLYSCLSPRQDTELGRQRLARRFEAGQVVVHHDTPALAVLTVLSGKVKLTRSTSNGQVVLVGTRGAGDLVGVREVLSALPYQASVETLEPSVVCAVPRECFLHAVQDCPDFALRLLLQQAQEHLLAVEQLVARSHGSVIARTARQLVLLASVGRCSCGRATAVQGSVGRGELALLVGTTRETLSRTLHRLAGSGAVKLTNGTIEILDRPLLERFSEQ